MDKFNDKSLPEDPIFVCMSRLIKSKGLIEYARALVELVDTRDLKSLEGNFVPVQVRLWAPSFRFKYY